MLRIKLGPRKTVDESADPFLPRNNAGWESGLTPNEIYEASRGWWVLNRSRAEKETHAVVVCEGKICLVIAIEEWASSPEHDSQGKLRHAFRGRILQSGDRMHELVGRLDPMPSGRQNPIAYVRSELE
jgi:hypothetical protein